MAIKLGELLVQEGLVSQEDLDEALRYQVIYGGKLGTNLIEMGLIEEGEITRILSKKLGIPFAPPERLLKIPQDIIAVTPREIAEKYMVVPIAREGKKLFLAMDDPSNLLALDEISFRTGFIVKPILASEVRLILALEKYYGIERERRYISLEKRMATAKKKRKPETVRLQPPPPVPSPVRAQEEKEEFIEIPGLESNEEIEELEAIVDAEELEQIDVIEDLADADVIEEYTLEMISRLLTDAGDREDIADILIGYLAQEFDRGALFQVRGAHIGGWRAMNRGKSVETFSQLAVPLGEPSVLKTVVESRSTYLGAIARNEINDRVFHALGGPMAATGLLVPLQIMGRVVGLLYVDDRNVNLSGRTVDLQKLAAKASMAFEILILKQKILML